MDTGGMLGAGRKFFPEIRIKEPHPIRKAGEDTGGASRAGGGGLFLESGNSLARLKKTTKRDLLGATKSISRSPPEAGVVVCAASQLSRHPISEPGIGHSVIAVGVGLCVK